MSQERCARRRQWTKLKLKNEWQSKALDEKEYERHLKKTRKNSPNGGLYMSDGLKKKSGGKELGKRSQKGRHQMKKRLLSWPLYLFFPEFSVL